MREQQVNEDCIKNILDQFLNYSVDVNDAELRNVKARNLLVVGNNDQATPLESLFNVKSNMPNAFLCIGPNMGQRAQHDKNKDLFIKTSKDFFNTRI